MFRVWAAPATGKPLTTGGPRSGPPIGRGFRVAGTVQTQITGDFRSVPTPCIKNPTVPVLFVTLALDIDQAKLVEWHRPRIQSLIEAKCDVLACETIPCLLEARATALNGGLQ